MDHQQVTLVTTLNRFCPLSKKKPTPVLTRHDQAGRSANQNAHCFLHCISSFDEGISYKNL